MPAPELIELTGPLSMGVVVGVIAMRLEAAQGSTLVRLSHRAAGLLSEADEQSYTDGWRLLLDEKLRAYVERNEVTGLRAGAV